MTWRNRNGHINLMAHIYTYLQKSREFNSRGSNSLFIRCFSKSSLSPCSLLPLSSSEGTNNLRLTLGGAPIMDTSDWRAQLQPQLREIVVKEIMDTMKLWHDFNNEDELELELEKVAQSFERKTYAGATSLSDYFQIIKSKMVSMERQTKEETYLKIKNMKEKYFPELNEMYQKFVSKLQQYESLPQHTNSEQLNKLKMFKTMLERIITFLQVSKSNVLPNFKVILGRCEKLIINFINTNRPRKLMSSLQPGQLPPSSMHSMPQSQSQLTQVQSHENQINSQLQPTNLQGSVATMP